MKALWIAATCALVLLTVAAVMWLAGRPQSTDQAGSDSNRHVSVPAIRIGLTPEQDVFEQRRRYRILAEYLAAQLDRPVQLLTCNTYDGVLEDIAAGQIDAAFVGSLVAAVAIDHHGARAIVKPELEDGVTSYRGVIFARADSPILPLDDLAGLTIGMVRDTTAGHLFPAYELHRRGLSEGPGAPQIVWVGTHDAVIREVVAGRIDLGAAKDLRLDAYEREHPEVALRRLAVGPDVPNNPLIVRQEMLETLGERLAAILLRMHEDPQGRAALEGFEALRFVPCDLAECVPICRMSRTLGGPWELKNICRLAAQEEGDAAMAEHSDKGHEESEVAGSPGE